MPLFTQRTTRFKVLEVEQSMSDVFVRVKDFLIKHSPSIIWMPSYAKAVHWTSLHIKKGNPELRGLARESSGNVELRLNQSLRWMTDGSYSQLNGREDLTPTGILAHELGHQFQWSFEAKCGKEAPRLLLEYIAIGKATNFTDYGKTSSVEDFAETYRLFLLNPPLLKKLSPIRYEWFVAADELFHKSTGFEHGLTRTAANPVFAMRRFDDLFEEN